MYMKFLSIYLFIYLSIYLSLYLSLSIYLSIYPSIYLSIYPSIRSPQGIRFMEPGLLNVQEIFAAQGSSTKARGKDTLIG